MSGAIATCIIEVGRVALEAGATPVVITRRHPREDRTLDWPALELLDPLREDEGARLIARRVKRRLNGWARPDQWDYCRAVVPRLRNLLPSGVVVNNDPEIAVTLRHQLPTVPVVHWFHNLELASDRFRRRFAQDPGIRSVAVSRYLARAVEQVYGMTPLSVHAVPNGVNLGQFPFVERATDTPTIGYLGRLAVEKGADVLLQASLLLRERGLDFTVQLAGDTNWGEVNESPFSRTIDRLLDDLRAAGIAVRRLGHVRRDDLPRVLAQTDIHVVPSRWDEPFGLTVVEGLASGQPVVASATGGIPEVIAGAGFTFPREDPEALAEVLENLLRDPQLRRHWGVLARHRAEQLPWSRTWQGLDELTQG